MGEKHSKQSFKRMLISIGVDGRVGGGVKTTRQLYQGMSDGDVGVWVLLGTGVGGVRGKGGEG